MRSILLFCCLFLAGTLSAQNVSDKVEAYFSFDNDCKAIDDSGNGSSGALLNGISCTCGLRDSSMRLDGLDDAMYFVGPFADVFTTSDFTISFYIKPPSTQTKDGTQLIMSKQSGCNTKHAFWVRYATKSRKITSSISENDSLLATVQGALDAGPCWQFVTLTRNNTHYSLYINGALRDTRTTPARLDLTSTATFKVGEPTCPLDQYFKGDFDELRFHSKALDAEAISRYNLRADQILNVDTLVYLGNSIPVHLSQFCAQQFIWSPSEGVSDTSIANPVIKPNSTGIYTVSIKYDGGVCVAHDTIHFNVINPDSLDCNKIFIPNAFTPGGSPGRNDVFGISNPFAVDEFISFEIFDRWGGRVFNAANQFETWDGTASGQNANPGVFLYRLRYKCQGVEKVKAGNLTLLR